MKSKERPSVIHECERCHATLTPMQSGQSVNVTGLIDCKACGFEGPLNIKVIENASQGICQLIRVIGLN
jgi:hypothetical protein